MSTFSTALQLTDLNDYIAPSQACIKPVEIPKSNDSATTALTQDEATGAVYQVTLDDPSAAPSSSTQITETATISLNDCLACSGCVTSAETVLITAQSHLQVLEHINKSASQGSQDDARPLIVSVSRQSLASLAAKYNLPLMGVARRVVWFAKHVLGAAEVVDVAFARDVALMEATAEFVERKRIRGRRALTASTSASDAALDFSNHALPMLASACPGWICYAEKTQPYVLPLISNTKSPQQISGSLVRSSPHLQRAFHVAVMPCYDKKLEASRQDFYDEILGTRDVDCVLATTELDVLFGSVEGKGVPSGGFVEFPEACDLGKWWKMDASNKKLVGTPGSSSGGYLEHLMVAGARSLMGGLDLTCPTTRAECVTVTRGRSADVELRLATVYGFKNIQNALRKLRQGHAAPGDPAYHYVEIMACPSGCVNGGGQMPPPSYSVLPKEWVAQVEEKYRDGDGDGDDVTEEWAHENAVVREVIGEMVARMGQDKVKGMLRTGYRAVEQTIGLSTVW
ncbi:iron hydrogenase [Catenaria anguillulae PL171]|uniref:Cytosolic Fe-S cluster assembly factor NAR1 n=1 Tax=Catenaria anguillulae PL171 TaxID=765915 RepID=A0A1Y2HRJ4_9FUNG|nr:iron hydrogenase [Catenaria anguillulae PL171]